MQLVPGAWRGCREGCTSHVPAIRQSPPACLKPWFQGWLTWLSRRVFLWWFCSGHQSCAVPLQASQHCLPPPLRSGWKSSFGTNACLPQWAPCQGNQPSIMSPSPLPLLYGSSFSLALGMGICCQQYLLIFLFFFKPKTLNSALTAHTLLGKDTLGPNHSFGLNPIAGFVLREQPRLLWLLQPERGRCPPAPPSSECCHGREGWVTVQFTALYSLAAIGSFAVLSNQHVLTSTVYWALSVDPHLFCTGPCHINIFSFF